MPPPEPDYDALLAALDDPLGQACLGPLGEPDLQLTRSLLPPLVGPTFIGDRDCTEKPLVRTDGTIEGWPGEPLRIEPGQLRSLHGYCAMGVEMTGRLASGRTVKRALFAVHETDGDLYHFWRENQRHMVRRNHGEWQGMAPKKWLDETDHWYDGVAIENLGDTDVEHPVELVELSYRALYRSLGAFVGKHPKYGWGGYEGEQHDTFPPTIIAMSHALCDWGNKGLVAELLGHWLENFVRDDGSLDYYGPSLSECGMLLDVAARVAQSFDLPDWTPTALPPCRRIADRLLKLREQQGGLLPGLPEADYHQDPNAAATVYYGNNLWCARGLAALADWLAEDTPYRGEAEVWYSETRHLIQADTVQLPDGNWYIPPAMGQHSPPPTLTSDRDASYANYRFLPEMLSSGLLSDEQAEVIFRYRETHGGELCGTTRLHDWLDDWPAMEIGLAHLDYGRRLAAQRLFVGHVAFHHAAGHGTVYEQCTIRPGEAGCREPKAGFCVPAELVTPRLFRHLLVHDSHDHVMLNPGGFRAWLEDISAYNVPTRCGDVSFELAAEADDCTTATVYLDQLHQGTQVTLRVIRRDGGPVAGVRDQRGEFYPGETVTLPVRAVEYQLRTVKPD